MCAIYYADTPATLKQGQGHQTKNANADPEQGHYYTKFEDLALMVLEKKPALFYYFFFFSNEEVCQLSSLDTCKRQMKKKEKKERRYIHDVLGILNNSPKLKLNRMGCLTRLLF